MGIVIWGLHRQVEALRQSLSECIHRLSVRGHPIDLDNVISWLETEGLSPHYDRRSVNQTLEERLYSSFEKSEQFRIMTMGNAINFSDEEDFGRLRSNAGWQENEKFVVTSAFVRLLGAAEQFEMDVLKSLLFYRPLGSVPLDEQECQTVTSDIILEKPTIQGQEELFTKPAIWTWLKRHAENGVERRKIFSKVFNLRPKLSLKEEWKDTRNAVAHGRSEIDIRLMDYSDLEIYVFKLAEWMRITCLDNFKLIL